MKVGVRADDFRLVLQHDTALDLSGLEMRLSHIMLCVDGKSTLANVLVILQVNSYTEKETVSPA